MHFYVLIFVGFSFFTVVFIVVVVVVVRVEILLGSQQRSEQESTRFFIGAS